MGSGDSQQLLLVSPDPVDPAGLESQLSDTQVVYLPELPRVFEELTTGVYDCLVLPATVGDQAGTDVACGIATMYPELPVVVVGTDVPEETDRETIVTVAAASLVDSAVASTVKGVLMGPSPSVAGREPSPMETLLLSLFDGVPDNLYAKDTDARHVMLGSGFNQPTDRLGLTDTEVDELHEKHGEAALRDEMDVIEGVTDRIEVEEFLDLDASYVRTNKVPWYDADGDVRGLVGLTQDITERKVREHDLRRQHERMVKIALVAAHEFRNELQIARGRLEQISTDQDHVDCIDESLARTETIVDMVVDLSSKETAVEDTKPIWLSRLSREVWDTLAESEATLEVAEDSRVVADQEVASLLLQFLFQNAIEHGGRVVTVTVGATETGFFVADDGAGIDADSPERVLDPGYSTVEGNTGFGLYIAKTVAEDHDWTLSVAELSDGGARFDIENVNLDA